MIEWKDKGRWFQTGSDSGRTADRKGGRTGESCVEGGSLLGFYFVDLCVFPS